MPKIILIEHPLSPYSQKVRILLREKNLSFEPRLPEGIGSDGAANALRWLNPRLEVPVLQHDDEVLFDSSIILEFLEEAYPRPPMMPSTPLARARARRIEEICDTHWEAINWGVLELRYFDRGGADSHDLMGKAEQDVRCMQDWLGCELADRPWLNGECFGWADLVATPFVDLSAVLGFEPKENSPLASWLERVRQQPSIAKTLAEGYAVLPAMEGVAQSLKSGDFRRQYRDHRLEWMIRSGGIQVVLDGIKDNNIRFNALQAFRSPLER